VNYLDAHVHVWTDNLPHYPLAAGFTVEQHMRPRAFPPETILRLAGASGVNRIVLIQISFYRWDNSYMLDVIAGAPATFRGVALVDWTSPAPEARMRELAKRGVTGFRIRAIELPPEHWLDGDSLARMFRCAADTGLNLCPLLNPEHLPALARMCRKFPRTPVVIDHLARIGGDGTIRDADLKSLCALAQFNAVKVKLSAQ